MGRKAAEFDQFQVRLPPGMREQIKRSAEESGRSMNAEIVEVLREYFPADPDIREVSDHLLHSIGLLRIVEKGYLESGSAPPGSVNKTIDAIQSAIDGLDKILGKPRVPSVVVLSEKAIQKLAEIDDSYRLSPDLIQSVASDLIVMGAEQVLKKEARLRAHIGEGEAQRIVEIKFPDED